MILLMVQCCNRHPGCPFLVASTNRSKLSAVKSIVLALKDLKRPADALADIDRLVSRRAAISLNSSQVTMFSTSSTIRALSGEAIPGRSHED